MEILMKTTLSLLFAAALSLSSMPAHAVKWDLSTMSCKQFLESGEDNIQVVLTWMDGWYKGDEDNAIIDTDVFIENAKKFGAYCGKNPTASIVTAADESSVTRPKLMVRPSRTTRASASTSEEDTARMKCVVWSTVVMGR